MTALYLVSDGKGYSHITRLHDFEVVSLRRQGFYVTPL